MTTSVQPDYLRKEVMPLGGRPVIDLEKRSATFIISTDQRDRVGDVMVPGGIDTTRYALNPVVLFGHDQRTFAIGKCAHPDGSLAITVEANRVLATVYLHEETEAARVAWKGICEGWLGAASIGFNPISDPVPLPPIGRHKGGFRYEKWELLEWSLVTLAMNPACVLLRRHLETGSIDGEAISEAIFKSLAGGLLEKATWREEDVDAEDADDITTKALPPAADKPAKGPPPADDPAAADDGGAKPDQAFPALIAQLTEVIASMQTLIQPKEQPAPPAAEPPMGSDDEEESPEGGDDPEADLEDREDQEDALARYRRAARAQKRKAAAAQVTKMAGMGGLDVLKAVADHLDEMTGMEPGTKWAKMHSAACSHHSGMVRKLCKAMEESAMDQGGAAVPPGDAPGDMEEKALADALGSRLDGLSDLVYRITGKRVG